MATTSPRRFTGRHAAIILVAFFGVVIAVNLVMARMAIGTFGGTVVDSSYVASQRYNDWLAAARAQAGQSWQATATLDADRHAIIQLVRGEDDRLAATGTAHHPVGRATERTLRFRADGAGRLRSVDALPAGRWQLRLAITNKGEAARLMESVQ